jgi:hypothetical protein
LEPSHPAGNAGSVEGMRSIYLRAAPPLQHTRTEDLSDSCVCVLPSEFIRGSAVEMSGSPYSG